MIVPNVLLVIIENFKELKMQGTCGDKIIEVKMSSTYAQNSAIADDRHDLR